MKVLFIVTSSEKGFWLSEVTHPYWHLSRDGIAVDFASPAGGGVFWSPLSDPNVAGSKEADDLISQGLLAGGDLVKRLQNTLAVPDIQSTLYDALHIAGGRGATFDLYPNVLLASLIEEFLDTSKVVGAICHGTIALGNVPSKVRDKRVTGFSLNEDRELERDIGEMIVVPNYPQSVLEDVGALYSCAEPHAPFVVTDGNLITGQNQQSTLEYSVALQRGLTASRAAKPLTQIGPVN